jgi:hypothetical protein
MAQLDINELLNRSIASVSTGTDEGTETNENTDLNLDLEGAEGEGQDVDNSALNLDLESIDSQINLGLDEEVMTKLKAALAAGVATSAVLEARQEARLAE